MPVVRNCSMHQNHLEDLLKQTAGLHTRVSDSVVLKWDLSLCIFNQFPGDADAAGLGTTLGEPLV